MIYLERAVFPCRIQYYLNDICTLMLPLCFQFSALTHNYLHCHLFKSPGKGKINLALCAFWSLEWEPKCLKSQKLLLHFSLLNVMAISYVSMCSNKHPRHFSVKAMKAVISWNISVQHS